MQIGFKKSSWITATITACFIVLFLANFQAVTAQTGNATTSSTRSSTGGSIVTCGQTATDPKCTIGALGPVVKKLLTLVISIGMPLLFIFVAYRFVMAWFSLQQGNANAYKDALQKAGNAIFGFLIVVILVGGGLYTILKIFGIDPKVLELLNKFTVGGLVPHAYAYEEAGFLPRFTEADNLYDFILDALRLVMRFFIYPSLIVIWVWTGFSFVLAQGAPEALSKAKKWLLWAVVTTLVIMILQGFLIALRNSANRILDTPSAGEACTLPNGSTGQTGTDGTCYAGRGG